MCKAQIIKTLWVCQKILKKITAKVKFLDEIYLKLTLKNNTRKLWTQIT